MKKSVLYIIGLIFIISISSCRKSAEISRINVDSLLSQLQQPTLAEFLYQSGNYITQKDFPPVISQYEVLKNKDKYLLIDIRKPESYEAGHIDGAYNVSRDSLLYFLTNEVNPAAYEKIVIICYTGQTATYSAALLHFYGIGNVYALKFGMAGWSKKFRNITFKNLSGKYENRLDTTTYPKPQVSDLPDIAKQKAFETLSSRISELLKLPAKEFMVSAEQVFENPQDYFIISYLPPAKYKAGHIPTAVRYNTRSDLSLDKDLKTLPKDKKIVVYCNIGQHSAATVAYLRLLGYQAYSLKFGLNSFMNNKAKQNGWFSESSFLDLPIITGKQRTSKTTTEVSTNITEPTTQITPPPVVGSTSEPEGGGCE